MRFLVLMFICATSVTSVTIGQTLDDKISKINNNGLIIYGSDSCHYCLETKTYLKERNIAFTYFDVDLDEIKLQEMLFKMKQNGLSIANVSLPVVDQGGKIFMNDQEFDTFLQLLTQKK